jgi:hypothetical protein
MLDGIDLLSNYETFSAVKEVEGSNKTALNVKIKKEYLGKITGKVELLGAYDKRYQAHSNLFKFNEKINITSIVNLNNTGYQPLSSRDYFSMNKSVRQDMRNNDVSLNTIPSTDNMPSFLLSDDNVTSKKNEFISFDIAYQPNAKLSMNGFSIFNKLRTTENIFSSRLFLNISRNFPINETTNRQNGFFYNQSKFNIDFKPNKNSLWNYTILFDLNSSNAENNIFNNLNDSSNNIFTNQERLQFSLGHQISYIRKIAKNKLLSFNLFHEIKKQDYDLGISSNIKLFNANNSFIQTNGIKKNDIGFYAKYTQKLKKHLLRISTGFTTESATFKSNNSLEPNGSSTVDVRYAFLDISIQKKAGKFNYKAKVEARPYFLQNQSQRENQLIVLPSLQVKYNFSETHSVLGSYNRTVDFPRVERLNGFDYAEDFRTLALSSPIRFNTLLAQDIFSVNYFRFNLYHGIVISATSSYIRYGNRISNNTNNISTYNETSPILTKNQFAWNNSVSYEHRISKIKNKIRVGGGYVKSNFINQINGLQNVQDANFASVHISLSSYFKKTYFNYEAGFNYSFQRTRFKLFNQLNAVKRITPSIAFTGIFAKKWTYRIDNAYENFIAQTFATKFYNLGFKLKYKTKKIQYWAEGNNLLYLNNAQVIKASSSNNILSTEIVNRLAGYIGIGLGFDL